MAKKGILIPVLSLLLCAVILFAVSACLAPLAKEKRHQEHLSIMKTLLPGSESFVLEPYTGEDTQVRSVHKAENGFVVETCVQGYAGEITMIVGVSTEGKVTGLVVRDLQETFGLGAEALTDKVFLSQFLNKGEATIGEGVDALTGATVTSKSIARGINSAVAVVTGADTSSGATSWGG